MAEDLTQPHQSHIDDGPELAQEIGRIAIEWSHLERDLSFVLARATGTPGPVAMAIFEALRNGLARRDILDSCARLAIRDRNARAEIESIILEANRIAKERNAAVHTPWVVDKKNPRRMTFIEVRAPTGAKSFVRQTKSLKQLRALTARVIEHRKVINAFAFRGMKLYMFRKAPEASDADPAND